METSWRRRTFPKQILPHVVHGLKAQRRLMVGVCQQGAPLGSSSCSSVLKLLLLVFSRSCSSRHRDLERWPSTPVKVVCLALDDVTQVEGSGLAAGSRFYFLFVFPESLMRELTAAAPGLVRQAQQVVQSIRTVQLQAEGLRQVLDLQPSATTLQVHRDVFGTDAYLSSGGGAGGPRQPIRRAVAEAAEASGYVRPSQQAAD